MGKNEKRVFGSIELDLRFLRDAAWMLLAIAVVSAALFSVSILIGRQLDRALGTRPVLTLISGLAGLISSGYINLRIALRTVARLNENSEPVQLTDDHDTERISNDD